MASNLLKMAINLNAYCVLVEDKVEGNLNGTSVVHIERNWNKNIGS